MDKDTLVELLEKLGYEGTRLDAMCGCLKEYARRKVALEGGELTNSDIVTASLIFDAFNKKQKGK